MLLKVVYTLIILSVLLTANGCQDGTDKSRFDKNPEAASCKTITPDTIDFNLQELKKYPLVTFKRHLIEDSAREYTGIRQYTDIEQKQLNPIIETIEISFDTLFTSVEEELVNEFPMRFPSMVPASKPRYKDKSNCNIQYLDVDQGMSSSYIYTVLADRRDMIWFGTYEGGLTRYNGNSFLHFTKDNGLPGNSIRAMAEDSHGNIWIGTAGDGLCVFDGHNLKRFDKDSVLSKLYVYEILEDSRGDVWVATRKSGLFCIRNNKLLNITKKNGLPDNEVYTIFEDHKGSIWIGTNNGILKKDSSNNMQFTFVSFADHKKIKTYSESSNGTIYIAAWGALLKYESGQFYQFESHEVFTRPYIKQLLIDDNDNVWIGTTGNGIYKFSESVSENKFRIIQYTSIHGLGHNYVSDLALLNGNLWIATYGGGANRFRINSFEHITIQEGIENDLVWAFAEDMNQNIWFGTERAGMSRFNGSEFKHVQKKSGLLSHIVLSSVTLKNGDLVFGTYKGDAYRITEDKIFRLKLNESSRPESIISICESSDGSVWFGSWGNGVYRLKNNNVIHITIDDGLTSGDVFDIHEDSQGDMWFATDGGGVLKLSENKLIAYAEHGGLTTNDIRSLEQINDSILWIGTYGKGVVSINTKTNSLNTIDEGDGLTSNHITSLIKDKQNRVWVGTESGLNLIEKPYNHCSIKADDELKNVIKFEKPDGLKGVDFYTNAVFIDSKNTIWWGTGKAITKLDLNDPVIDTSPTKVNIEALQINQRWVDFHNFDEFAKSQKQKSKSWQKVITDKPTRFFNTPENIEVPYGLRHITFHYIATDWDASHKINYRTRLSPLEDEWGLPTKETKADYRNIPPGDYEFQVYAIGRKGIQTEIATQRLTIRPPWWMTWWAYTMYPALVFVIVALIFRWRTRILKRRQKELEKIVDERTNEIKEKNEELETLVTQVTSQRNEIASQRDTVVQQKEQLEQVHKEISQSIDYAKRIQSSLLPDFRIFESVFPDSFVFFRPRDIVSGDFYWWTTTKNGFLVVVADCTGHGVPGAFMSMLGVSFLREIVLKEKIFHPDEILNRLRQEVINAMKQQNKPGEQRDGMDMTILSFNFEQKKVSFAGANNSVLVVRDGELIQLKGDANPVAAYPRMNPFSNKELELLDNDCFYMFTDGYHDQFGKGKIGKLKKSRFRNLIMENSQLKMTDQGVRLNEFMDEWKGDGEQIDDMLVVGIRLQTEKTESK